MPEIRYDTYYRYEELTQLLQAFADEYPDLVSVDSIGKSQEGRDIWVATVTNQKSGPADEKPALWVDGNIHASEVSPSTACLHYLYVLTNGYGKDEAITRCLNTRTTYICPRIAVDGAEWALADPPKIVRSGTRAYPIDEETQDGLTVEDIDGDGRLLTMRIEDPSGNWKAYEKDPRLMIPRDPIEVGGTYYRLVPEGRLKNFDGYTIKVNPPKEGLDFNRNFPSGWRQQNEQPGAGPYPLSESETRTVVDFMIDHPNVVGGVSYHTLSGALLRPREGQPDESLPVEDLRVYKKSGEQGEADTGYPAVSIFHGFRYHPKQVIGGTFFWMYEHLGTLYWAVEIWSPQKAAGIEEVKFIEWYRQHPLEDDLKLLQWSDEALDGKGYVDWYEIDHPQLGKVELGGWDRFMPGGIPHSNIYSRRWSASLNGCSGSPSFHRNLLW